MYACGIRTLDCPGICCRWPFFHPGATRAKLMRTDFSSYVKYSAIALMAPVNFVPVAGSDH